MSSHAEPRTRCPRVSRVWEVTQPELELLYKVRALSSSVVLGLAWLIGAVAFLYISSSFTSWMIQITMMGCSRLMWRGVIGFLSLAVGVYGASTHIVSTSVIRFERSLTGMDWIGSSGRRADVDVQP